MPQFNYTRQLATNGQVTDVEREGIRSYTNALLAQITNVVWAGTTNAGDYSIRIVGGDGEVDETITFAAPGVTTPNDVAEGITAQAALLGPLLNVVAVADPTADTNTLTFVHTGRAYDITVAITNGGNGTGTVNPVQAAGGTRVPLGVVVVQGPTDGEGRLPVSGSTSANALGITVKSVDSDFNTGDPLLSDGFKPGRVLPVLRSGAVWVYTEDAVAANASVFFRKANAVGANEAIGRVRSDADGGDAVQLFGARFLTSASAGELVKVAINLPANA